MIMLTFSLGFSLSSQTASTFSLFLLLLTGSLPNLPLSLIYSGFLLVIIFFIYGRVTIRLFSLCWYLFGIDIVEYIGLSMRYTSSSRNEYIFMISIFLKALKLRNKIWNSIAIVCRVLKLFTLYFGLGKSLFTSGDSWSSYVNRKVS